MLCVFFFKDMHYNTRIRTFCILKKMAFSAFHYLTLSVRCEELDAHINYLYLFLKSIYCEYILEKILSTSEVGPILALIAPSPLIISQNIFASLQWSNQILFYRSITITPVMWPTFWTDIQVIHVNFARRESNMARFSNIFFKLKRH